MNVQEQRKKAERLRELHHDPKLLVLPNVWDPLGARLLQGLGFPAVATASAAVAFSLGYDDGQRISFDALLEVVARIASSIDLPLSVDVERGYADDPRRVAANVRRVLHAGAVGINLEDSVVEGGPLRAVEVQCRSIGAVRAMAGDEGIPLVINARTDVFLREAPASRSDQIAEVIERSQAYLGAGADCIYPIPVGDLETLGTIHAATHAPINVYASASAAPMRDLEAAGMARLSLGPGFLRAAFTTMKRVALGLKNYDSYTAFTEATLTSDEVREYVRREKMT
jgi:2-methylisocitrate lyase-like PEP mutase family enzyme